MATTSSKSKNTAKTPAKKAKDTAKRDVSVTSAAKKAAPKWKIVGEKVRFSPGTYTLEDIEAVLKKLNAAK